GRGGADSLTRARAAEGAPPQERPRRSARVRSLEAVVDPSLGQVVGRHLDLDLVAGENADAVLAHLAGGMGNDGMAVLELHPESRIGQKLFHDPGKFKKLFLGHEYS